MYTRVGVWEYECIQEWVYGSMSVYKSGCMGVLVYTRVGVWEYECIQEWVYGSISVYKSGCMGV